MKEKREVDFSSKEDISNNLVEMVNMVNRSRVLPFWEAVPTLRPTIKADGRATITTIVITTKAAEAGDNPVLGSRVAIKCKDTSFAACFIHMVFVSLLTS